jgi:hypothetical protein
MPVMLPLAMLQQLYVDRRKAKCVESTVCFNCHKSLGKASLERADLYWRDYLDKLHRENPNVIYRLVRSVAAMCDCGQKYSYNEKSNCFEVLADLPS